MNEFVTHFDLRNYLFAGALQNPAVEYGNDAIAYKNIIERIEQRTKAFIPFLKTGDIVAINRPKSPEYVVDFLSVLFCGGIVMPIDGALPAYRRSQMVNIVRPRVLIAADGNITQNRSVQPSAVPMNGPCPEGSANSAPRGHGRRAAYVFFTSGSTGRPKAILGSLDGLVEFIRWQGKEFKIGPADRVSFLTGLGFDVSLRDILLPLMHGATLVIPSENDLASPQSTVAWLVERGITRTHAVPSVARIWARAQQDDRLALKTLFLAGEKLLAVAVDELRQAFPNITEFVNLYGPTETTLAKFFFRVKPEIDYPNGEIPVGLPIPGADFRLSGNGEVGEIVISTPHASFGYIGASEEENSRFTVADGLTTYYTGDLGRITNQGELVVVGRIDDELKVNGVRVHPTEVECALSRLDMIDDVAVVGVKLTEDSESRLAAFWTAKAEVDTCAADAPRSDALTYLPQAIVPTIWRLLDSLPQNANGKIDRASLQKHLYQSTTTTQAPVTDTEKWVLDAVANILSIPTPGIEDNVFALGCTSLHIAFLIGRIEDDLKKSLDFSDLFRTSVLKDIAATIDAAPAKEVFHIPPIGEKNRYHMSPQQRRWWNIYMPKGNRSWATMVRVVRFDKLVEANTVREALFKLVVQQDSMGLWFDESGPDIMLAKVVCPSLADIDVAQHDLSSLSQQDADSALNDIRLRVANSEIDTGKWPLFRVHLVALPDQKSTVIFAIHHMVSDGFSMGLIENALHCAVAGNDPKRQKLAFNYLDYAAWATDRELHTFGDGSPAKDYWQDLFRAPYKKHIFPELWHGPDGDRGQGYCREVPQTLRAAITKLSRQEHVTEFSIYLAAKMLAWHHLLKQEDLVIGTPAAGCDIPGTQELIGNFISLVCIRSRLQKGLSHIEYVRQIMHSVALGMTHQNYQYDTLVKDIGMEFEQARFPLTTIFISYLNFEAMRSTPLCHRELGFSDLGFAVKFDLMSYVREHKDATSLQVQYRNNLFEKPKVEEFVDTWLSELARVTASER
ncbi:MAG: AMP-binding protein [Hormoscilla sp. GUM202]|nr:AMP-binding protein [Hormoscilla sp. GUM202]